MKEKNKLIDKRNVALYHYPDKCTGCGLCVDICENFQGALELNHIPETGKTELKIDEEKCKNCSWCAVNCPFEALEFLKQNEPVKTQTPGIEIPKVRKSVKFEAESCVVCGKCEETCPQNSIKVSGKIKITSNNCTLCGLCADQCPENAISINSENNEVIIEGDSCVRCGACEQTCPTDSILVNCLDCLDSLRETGHLEEVCYFKFESSVSFDEDECIYCGQCETVCPAEAIKVRKPFEGHISAKTENCEENCTSCIELCPTSSIEKLDSIITIDDNNCIYCGICYRICSSDAINFERETFGITDNKGKLALRIGK